LQSPKETRRNTRLTILNGALMIGTTNSVAAPDLVLTAFAAHLTSSPLILGLITPLQNATWSLPQIWTIGWLRRNRFALPLYHWSAVLRMLSWIALVVVVFLSRNPAVLLITLMLFVVMGGLAAGVTGLPFTEVVAKVIPARQRGLVFGWRGALGGALAIVGAPVVLFFTGPDVRFEFPVNFALLFIIGGLTQMLGFFSFSAVKEPPSELATEQPPLSVGLFRSIWRRNPDFRKFVHGRTLFELSSMANGLIIVYASQRLGVRLELAGMYLLVSSLLRPIFSVAAGRVSVRIGNRLPVAFGMLTQAIGWGLLLLALPLGVRDRAAEYYMIPVYALTAIQKGLIFSNLMALALNVTPSNPTERPVYMGGLNTWIGVVSIFGSLNGVIAGLIGFEALFALSLALSVLSAWQFMSLKERLDDEPAAA